MKIAVFGTGMVGRAIAARLDELGHDVTIGTRDPEATLGRTEADAMGTPPLAGWIADFPQIRLSPFERAAEQAELVINATNGAATLDALGAAGPSNLAGKVILDIANPLDFSAGMPPNLLVKDTDSLAEQIQRAFPDAIVVKALNTMGAHLMVHPEMRPGTVFLSGNDAAAKSHMASLLKDFGHDDVLDLGDISTARGPEMLLPLWLRIWNALGTADFNIQIVR